LLPSNTLFCGGKEIQVRYLITFSDDRSGRQMIKKNYKNRDYIFYIYYLLPTRVTIIVTINELCTRCTC